MKPIFSMLRRIGLVLSLVAPFVIYGQPLPLAAQAGGLVTDAAPRAIRRDVPLTNSIRRAFDAGTRDRTGRPGPNYWQLQTDYTINVRLDPATQTMTGTETITLHNNSPQALTEIMLRLDHNIFRPRVPSRRPGCRRRSPTAWSITKLAVNGEAVDLAAPRRRRRAAAARRARRLRRIGPRPARSRRITLGDADCAEGAATLEIDWRTKLPGGPRHAAIA